jgi:AcrR family transcriptional regulator
MARTTSKSAVKREPLSRERALAAAVTLADVEGIGSLTMRRLAQHLGVEAMSLYHHVANKDDILNGMLDIMYSEVELPDPAADWKTAMRRRAESLHAAMLRHRWSITVIDSLTAPGPATLRHLDAVLGSCRAAGFSIPMTAHAVALIDSYVYGFALQEINLPFSDGDDIGEVFDTVMAEFSPDNLPYLAEMSAEHVLQPGYRFGDEFAFGLGFILDGLDRMRG